MTEFYDWATDEVVNKPWVDEKAVVDVRRVTSVNPVTAHGNDCVCPKCPG